MRSENNLSDTNETVPIETTVLEAAARELRVPKEAISASRLTGDASSRTFVRVTHPGGTLVAVCYPWPFSVDDGSSSRLDRWCVETEGDGRLTFANDPLCHIEMTTLLERFGVPVPAIVAIADREGVLFVEDAGDDLLQRWLERTDTAGRAAAYERAVDVIAAIRAATDTALRSNSVAGVLAFDAAKLGWELDFFLTNCFDRFLGAPLDAVEDAAVRAECLALCETLSTRPRVLCHRDYHARNLIVRPGCEPHEGLVVIDFQDARMGPLTYDLVSLLEDPYWDLDPTLKSDLEQRFIDRAMADGVWPGADEFRAEYDVMTVQRLLKAIGTYTHQAAVRGKTEYIPSIAPARDRAARALDRIGRFPALRHALDRLENH